LPWLERQSGHSVKILQIDGGGEFLGSKLKEFHKNMGIQLRITIPVSDAFK
jgi:hypothetical protein